VWRALRLGIAALLTASCSAMSGLEEVLVPEMPLALDPSVGLLAPEQLHVRSNSDRTIVLSWNPVLLGDVDGYLVSRSLRPDGPFQPVGHTRSRFATIFADSGPTPGSLGDGQTYYYRVQAHDRTGRVSPQHAAVEARTEEKPAPPGGLTIYSSLPRKVVLTWSPSERRNVATYGIYRSPTAAGPYERVALVPGRLQTLHEDRVDGDLRVMYYRITALNQFGGESEMTPPHRAVTKAEPLPPIGLAVGARRVGAIELRWEPNVEPDLLAYEVWREERTQLGWATQSRVGEVPLAGGNEVAAAPRFTDASVGCGQSVRYRVRARDRDGLTSDYSPGLEARALDLGLTIGPDGHGDRELRWDPARTQGWPRARIDLQRGMGLPPRTLGRVENGARFALPPDLDPSAVVSVVLERPAEGAGSDATIREAPPCRISLRGAPSGEHRAER
jgi:fibronectin type 3 domain-containing protein